MAPPTDVSGAAGLTPKAPLATRLAEIYRRTRKPHDILWNRFVARPIAVVVLLPLERTRVSPNQVTLASLFVFIVAAVLLAAMPGWGGLLVAVGILELSYVLDCVDGQLARLRGTSTPIGAHLDFLMDELKAFLLVTATGLRLWQQTSGDVWLAEALFALCAVASGISLTTFVRRPEYVAATGFTPSRAAGDYGPGPGAGDLSSQNAPAPRRRGPIQLVESLGRYIIHYPSYLVFVALANRLDIFLHAYLLVNAAHAARSLLGIARRLGGSAR